MPLIRMRDVNLPWHASREVEGKREEFCSPSLSDTHEPTQVEQSLPLVIQNLMHVRHCNFIQLSDRRQSALELPDRRRESEREGELALALSRGEDKCVLSPLSAL